VMNGIIFISSSFFLLNIIRDFHNLTMGTPLSFILPLYFRFSFFPCFSFFGILGGQT